MRTLSAIGYLTFLMALYYAITFALGEAFLRNITDALFGGYVAYYGHYIGPNLPALTHPAVLVILAAAAATLLPGVLRLSRGFAMVILAVFLVRAGFALTGAEGAPPPGMTLFLAALFSVGWLFLSAALADPRLWTWLKERGGPQR